MATREVLHRLIDALPDNDLPAVEQFLKEVQAHSDPVVKALQQAPEDDEAVTAEEERLVEEARQALAQGEVSSLEEVRRDLLGTP